jgi:lysophospholipase L1-like esterase
MRAFPSLFAFFAVALVERRNTAIVEASFYPANDPSFTFEGRWQLNQDEGIAIADWPCSSIHFNVTTASSGATSITFVLGLTLLRVKVVVTDVTGKVESETLLEGEIIEEQRYDIVLQNENKGTYTVTLTKLTESSPYGTGFGRLATSVLRLYGIDVDEKVAMLAPLQLPSRRLSFVGASDTAGFCVDGTPETSDSTILPWKYDNCDVAFPAVLGRRLNADISVLAQLGMGVTQNAFAHTGALGKLTMPDYYNRTLQTKKQPLWDFVQWRPDAVIVSLGGNDFNHQERIPSNATFSAAYQKFLLQIAEPYLQENKPAPVILSICGQGDPTEVDRDPNNDRCRPCPHVKEATNSFRISHGEKVRAEYIFVPCDGTVVTGVGDIGCDGHKNELGQSRVADFLEPQLREIMGWYNGSGTVKPTVPPSPEPTGKDATSGETMHFKNSFGATAWLFLSSYNLNVLL